MIAVLQRVSSAQVTVDGELTGKIGRGLLVLQGVDQDDGEEEARLLAEKSANLRIFCDANGKMNLSLLDVGGAALVVSQFTLGADCRKGRRPSFNRAAPPEQAIPLYELFCEQLRGHGIAVETGRFGAMMDVALVNEGPVTLILDSNELKKSRRA